MGWIVESYSCTILNTYYKFEYNVSLGLVHFCFSSIKSVRIIMEEIVEFVEFDRGRDVACYSGYRHHFKELIKMRQSCGYVWTESAAVV